MKIRNKKQVQKIANAVRLLHKNAKWMWIDESGDTVLEYAKPDSDGLGYISSGRAPYVCYSGFDLKIPVRDTLVQLQGD